MEPRGYDYTTGIPQHEDMQLHRTTLAPLPPTFLDELLLPGEGPPPAAAPASAFRRYVGGGAAERAPHCVGPSGKSGVPKRVVELLRTMPMGRAGRGATGGGSQCHRHMMRERRRRGRQSRSYAELYSMQPPGGKADKISILQSSVERLKELKATESKLRRRNQELQARTAAPEGSKRVELRVGNPASPIDSAIACLQCVKRMDVKTTSFRSTFTVAETSVAVEIETEMAAKEVEECLQSVVVGEGTQRRPRTIR